MIIAAVRSGEEFDKALRSKARIIFDLAPDIAVIKIRIEEAHKNGKKLYAHMDLAAGIGKDKSGMEFLKNMGIDGIISTKPAMVRTANELGLKAVQRFFLIDSKSVAATIEGIKNSKADMIEVMPGIATRVIKRIKETTDVPVIAGGLIETSDDVRTAGENGAYAVSTGSELLWNM